jgi:hypothetical protein
MKSSTFDELDQDMVLWFSQQRAQGILVSGAFALYFFDELKLQGDFNASSGWLTTFEQRHGISQITVQGEKMICDEPAAEELRINSRNLLKMKVSYRNKFSVLTRPVCTGNVYRRKH